MTFFDSNNKKDCNGCGVCSLICPKKAITMVADDEGFLYPKINKKQCINCGLCKKRCSNINTWNDNNMSDAYIAINNNKKQLFDSSSGGCFYPIATNVLLQKGVVFGVAYDSNLIAKHIFIDNINELNKLQGSKYVRSDLNNSFIKVKEFIEQGRLVLFSGTPCQCKGIRDFIGDNNNLLTCEIICHANPSPKVFEFYKKNIERKYGNKIIDIKFRSKETGWHNQVPIITLDNNQKIYDDSYFKAFVKELINRPSCYSCQFCSTKRLSDFTIGDLWGIGFINPSIVDDDTGISLLTINTEKGRRIFDDIKDNFSLFETNIEKSFEYNHHCNVKIHPKREDFFKKINNGTINETNIIKYMNIYSKDSLLSRTMALSKNVIKKIINYK